VLTNVMIHWLTGTVASTMRIYYEQALAGDPTERTTVPLGLAQFRDDMHATRRLAERHHSNIVSWNVYDTAGHYAAHRRRICSSPTRERSSAGCAEGALLMPRPNGQPRKGCSTLGLRVRLWVRPGQELV